MSKSRDIINYTFTGNIGAVIALFTSWLHWHSVAWLIPAGLFGWSYVVYHLIRYGFLQR